MNYSSSANLFRKEEIIIAPYGTHSKDTRGRLYPEEEHTYRGCYQRDKHRKYKQSNRYEQVSHLSRI